jgi:hypothetical protein
MDEIQVVVMPMPDFGYREGHEKVNFSLLKEIMKDSNSLFSYRSQEEYYYFTILTSHKITEEQYNILFTVLETAIETMELWNDFEEEYGVSSKGFQYEKVDRPEEDREFYRVVSIDNDKIKCRIHYLDWTHEGFSDVE